MKPKTKQSFEALNLLIDNHPDAMVISDLNGNILAINDKLAAIFGKTKEELIGTSGYDNIETEAGISRRKIIEKVIKTKKQMELIDQERGRWWKGIFQPIFDKEGNVVKLAYYIQDITEKKEAEETFGALFQNSNDAIFIHDLEGNIVDVNRKTLVIFGYSKKDILSLNIRNLHPSYVHKESKRNFQRILKDGSVKFEIDFKKKNGNIFPAEVSSSIFEIGGNKVIQGIVRDITKRKEMVSKLSESEEKFRMLSDQSLMGIGIIQGNQIKYINEAITVITGYPKKEIISEGTKVLTRIIHPDDSSFVVNQLQKKLAGNTDVISRYPFRIITRNGEIKWIELFSKTINYKGKNADFVTFVDITARKKAEQEIQRGKEYLQNIIDSASEIIFTIGSDYKIKTWNKSAKMITGYKQSHVVGKSISKLTLFENQEELKDYTQTVFKGKIATLEEVTINTAFGIKKIFSVSPSFMRDGSENIYEILFVCRDITHKKERHGKLLFSQSYLISEATSETAVEIFAGMLRTGNPGLYIGRTSDSKIKNIFTDVTPTIVKLSKEKDKKHLTCSNFEELLPIIEEYVSKEKQSIVLLDRIEYLIINSSFESMIKNIYRLNDMMEKHNCLLLLRINPSLLDKTQMTILKEELQGIPEQQIDDVQLEETLFEILNYIQIETRRNALVSYSRIGNQFSISKVTTQRRIESLVEKGLIFSKKQGRNKTLHITDKGKNLLAHRSII